MKKIPPEEWVHGRVVTYRHFGCRCDICREAVRQYDREYRQRRPEQKAKDLERCRRYSERHPDRRSASAKRWREKNPEKHKAGQERRLERFRLNKYGVTEEERNRLLAESGGVCAICGQEDKRKLSIDHCHNSGEIRGLLCRRCNMGLGCFSDDPELLKRAAKYLV